MKCYLFCFAVCICTITGYFLFFMRWTILAKTLFFNLRLNRILKFFLIILNFIMFVFNNKVTINWSLWLLDLATWTAFLKYFLSVHFFNTQKIFKIFSYNFVLFFFSLYLNKNVLKIKHFLNKYFLLFKDKFNKLPFDIPYL